MLHKELHIISPETFLLIQQLQAMPVLNHFYLVGGTALALQLGHRNSIDIDLFTQNDIDTKELAFLLENKFNVKIDHEGKNTLLLTINNIKTDFIKHPYPFVKPPLTEESIQFLSKEDIAAMKLNAIARSGQRIKDFIDVFFLLQYFSVNDMLGFFEVKYPNTNTLIALKAISFFEDIDVSLEMPKVSNPVTLDQIKQRIKQAVKHPDKIFTS